MEDLIRKRGILAEDPRWVLNVGEIKPQMEAAQAALKKEAESFFSKYAA